MQRIVNIRNDYRYKRCPLCNSTDIRKSGDISYAAPVSFSTQPVILELTPELWKCQNCISCFSQNIVPENITVRLYSQGSSAERWSSLPYQERQPVEVIEALSGLFTEKTKVLDIGCNTGELLDFAKSMGSETSGIEPSVTCRDIIEGKGHTYYSCLADTGDSRFDVITAFDLIEHLYDVHSFLTCCADRLKKNGVLVICTGDISSLSARISQAKWWYIRYPEHVLFPSTIFFRDYSGFNIEKWIRTYASTGYIKPFSSVLFEFIKGMIKGDYSGLPSIGADHVLTILKK